MVTGRGQYNLFMAVEFQCINDTKSYAGWDASPGLADRFNHDGLVTEKRPDKERLLALNRDL